MAAAAAFDDASTTLFANDSDVLSSPANVTDDKLFDGYPPGLLKFASVTCMVYMVIGVPGNLITIIALARCKKVRNATAFFIINLSLADLLFCCFNLPLAASTYWHSAWTHGDMLCRLFPLLRYGLSAVSLFTITAITLNRYVMIGHPRVYPKIYRDRYLGVMVAGTWLGAFGALIATWRGTWGRFGLDRTIGSCSILPDMNNFSPKDFLFVMAFVVPCVAIVVCYARIFHIVRKTAMRWHEPAMQQKSLNTSMIIPTQRGSVRSTAGSRPIRNNNGPAAAPSATAATAATPLAGTIVQPLSGGGGTAADEPTKALLATRPSGRPTPPSKHNRSNRRTFESDSISTTEQSSEHSSSTTSTCHTHPHVGAGHAPRIGLKYIDSSVDSEMLGQPVFANSLHTSTVSIVKSVEFRSDVSGGQDAEAGGDAVLVMADADAGGVDGEDELEMSGASAGGGRMSSVRRKRFQKNGQKVAEVDSAVEESTSSSENNQIYHIRNESNCNTELAVHVEPSSSSGIDIPLDEEESPPRRLRRSLAASLRRIKRSRQSPGDDAFENTLGRINSRKHSTINTSGASILYPGRMTTKDRRLLKMILVILSAFVVCYLPITASKIFRSIQENAYLNIMGYLLIYLTTCINPIIYVVMSSEYRQAYWNLLMCRNGAAGTRRPTLRGVKKRPAAAGEVRELQPHQVAQRLVATAGT